MIQVHRCLPRSIARRTPCRDTQAFYNLENMRICFLFLLCAFCFAFDRPAQVCFLCVLSTSAHRQLVEQSISQQPVNCHHYNSCMHSE